MKCFVFDLWSPTKVCFRGARLGRLVSHVHAQSVLLDFACSHLSTENSRKSIVDERLLFKEESKEKIGGRTMGRSRRSCAKQSNALLVVSCGALSLFVDLTVEKINKSFKQ